MDWLVGMDLSCRGQGALAYAAWLRKAMAPVSSDDRFVGVHVLEEAVLAPLLRQHDLESLEQRAAQNARELEQEVGEGFELSERRAVHGRTAETTLDELAAHDDVRGLIIGRQAKRGERRLVRLGRVARRLLRSLHAPTIVVPPDLRQSSVGSGPILLAVDTDADGTAPVAFARTLAAELSRPLIVVHVISVAEYLVGYTRTAATEELLASLRQKHEHRLGIWMQMHDLLDVPRIVVEGPVVDGLAQVAKEQGAPLVVCGSRGLSASMRLFVSSVASDLAGACESPVAVVPDPNG